MADTARQSNRFLLLYALAWGGGAVAYVPFLTILLPVRVTLFAGQGADVVWLAYLAFAGAIAASVGHIGFGYLSDITRNRRGWILAGLVLSCALLPAISRARDFRELLIVIVCWQLALNMMLAPLAALAGDCIPDAQKGRLGGLLAFAPGLGALSATLVTMPGVASADVRLVLVAVMVGCCVLPVLLLGNQLPVLNPGPPLVEKNSPAPKGNDRVVLRMWLARLAIQIAEAALFAYLFFWFRTFNPAMSDSRTAGIFTIVLVLSAPIALIAGGWGDRVEKPHMPLVLCAAISAIGLVGMAMAPSLSVAIGTYALFGIATSVFLALHTAQTLRILPRPHRRGRDLGIFNLTNTVPSLVMPWLTIALVPWFGFSGLFLLFAGFALVAAILVRSFDPTT